MGKISNGQLALPTNLEVQISAPLDDRSVVEYYSDLISEETWTASDGQVYVYPGMLVTVFKDPNSDLNGVYELLDYNYGSYDNWNRIGGVNQETFERLSNEVFNLQQDVNSMVKITQIGNGLTIDSSGVLSATGVGSEIIQDNSIGTDITWSSSKINEELNDVSMQWNDL